MILVIVLSTTLSACDTEQLKYGEGGRNACLFVREQVPELRDDIDKIEVIGEDSLLGDLWMSFASVELAKNGAEYMKGNLKKEEYSAFIDSLTAVATDMYESWMFSIVVNDSIKQLPKYKDELRKVYKIRVTMKSGVIKEPRVLMDKDGLTPRMLEKDIEKSINDFTQKILSAKELLWY